MIKVYIEKTREDAKIPVYANSHDAGMDICACEDIILDINSTKIIPTGLKVAIPEGYEIQVRPRSGLSLNTRLRISNSPGR
jgi:dUTP pyrophosphatase